MRLNRQRRTELAEIVAAYPETQGDKLRSYFRDRGYEGTLSNLEGAWLRELGISLVTLADRRREFLSSPGATISDKVNARDPRRHPKTPLIMEAVPAAPIAGQPRPWWEAHAMMWA
jgi:hypothetical protein